MIMGHRLLWIVAAAGPAGAVHADDAAVRATLQRVFPNSPVQAIAKTPIPGVLETAIEGQVFYISEDGRYILGAPLIDARTNCNLTEASVAQVNAIPFDKLTLEWAIKWVKGTGARRIAIFEDPDCPYRRTLEQTLKSVDNLTVYIFLYPIDRIHPDAAAKSRAVWRAPDRAGPSVGWPVLCGYAAGMTVGGLAMAWAAHLKPSAPVPRRQKNHCKDR